MTDFVGDATLLPYQAGADRSYVADASLQAFVVAGVIATGSLFTVTAELSAYDSTGQIQGPVPLEAYEASGTIIPGDVARVAVVLEAYQVTPGQGVRGDAGLEQYTVSGAIARGDLARVAATLSGYTAEGRFGRIGDADVDVTLQTYTASGSIVGGNVARVSAALEGFSPSGTIIPGNLLRAAAALQPYQAQGIVYTNGVFTVDASLLPYTVRGLITGPAVEVTAAIALNTRIRAVTTYDNVPFNSLCTFQGVVLGGTADGLVSLQGDDDEGGEIVCLFESGVLNLGTDMLKRIPSAFTSYRAAGTLSVTLKLDEDEEYAYYLEPRQGANLHTSRVKFGRGLKCSTLQWRIENTAGCSFDMNYFNLLVEELSRRLG